MIKILIPVTLFLVCISTGIVAQTALEKGMNRLGIAINLPPFLSASENEQLIYVAEISETNPVPKIAQQWGSKPAFGDTYLNVMLGTVNSVLSYKNEECVVFVYTSPGRGGGSYGKTISDSTLLYTLNNISFARIKSNFKYGTPNRDATELDAIELYSMLTQYPHQMAQKMFNANVMVGYPLNLRGNVYNGKYTRGRVVAVGKDRLEFYLYFMMTDKSVLNFDRYLNDFSGVFWFKK